MYLHTVILEYLAFSILPKNERKISAPVRLGNNSSFQDRFLEELLRHQNDISKLTHL